MLWSSVETLIRWKTPGLTMTMSYTDYNETAADGTACTGTCDGTATNMAIDLSF